MGLGGAIPPNPPVCVFIACSTQKAVAGESIQPHSNILSLLSVGGSDQRVLLTHLTTLSLHCSEPGSCSGTNFLRLTFTLEGTTCNLH